jgi:hypothetical protein
MASYDYRERRISAIISDKLPAGLALNALGHLAFSAGHYSDNSWMGHKKTSTLTGTRMREFQNIPSPC